LIVFRDAHQIDQGGYSCLEAGLHQTGDTSKSLHDQRQRPIPETTAAKPTLPQICCQDRQANDKHFDNVFYPWQIFHLKNDTVLTLPAAMPILKRLHLTLLGK
jgi:hypothetical protein